MGASNCIYCGNEAEQGGDGDHVVPAALGAFKGAFLFKAICRKCNSEIGRCEEQLIRCAPEGMLLRHVAPVVDRSARGHSNVGASGAPPPLHVVDRDGQPEMVRAVPGKPGTVESVDHLVVQDKDGALSTILLFKTMDADALRRKIRALPRPPAKVNLYCNERDWEYYVGLLKSLWPGDPIVEGSTREVGVHELKVSTRFTVTSAFFRGVAKVALHYYLVNTSRGFSGQEDRFSDIRAFIRHGGEPSRFFTTHPTGGILLMPKSMASRGMYFAEWQHWLAFDEVSDAVTVMIALFVGPGHMPDAYHVVLGSLQGEPVVSKGQRGHRYVYADKRSTDRGTVEPLELHQMPPP